MAIALSILFFVGWQAYLQNKYPESYKAKDEKTLKQDGEKTASAALDDSLQEEQVVENMAPEKTQKEDGADPFKEKQVAPSKTFSVQSDVWTMELSSRGMGITFAELNNFTDRDEKLIKFFDPTAQVKSFATYYNYKVLDFSVEQKGENHFVGTASTDGNTLIKEMIFNPDNFTVEMKIKTLSGSAGPNDLIQTRLANQVLKVQSSMFRPAYEGTEFFTINDGGEERERVNIEEAYKENFDKSTLTAIGTHYFAIAVQDRSEIIPKTIVQFSPDNQVAYTTITHQAATKGNKTEITMTGFVGPKKYDVLKELDPNFVKMIDYGMFSILSQPMLTMLKWLHGLFSNWGLAIIFLTIFIRLLLLPINVSSLRSMKKMQKLQPQLKAIKEKYKEDPQRVNQETMALMKKEKANPLGGCLPMLLQLPVFLALYSVLGQSVELYKSPFIFWIQDLSYQDPFFVLPIAVGGLYFIQMSLTPQPTDAAQAKVMKFIPILFCFFMITVPSGLTLYFFVNTVFGIGQTFIFQREKRKAAA